MQRHCTTCGADVELSDWSRHRERHRRGGKGASSEQKRVVKRRQGNVCAECGSDGELQVHHRDGNWRNNSYTNLVALCVPCHRAADEEIRKAREQTIDVEQRPRTLG